MRVIECAQERHMINKLFIYDCLNGKLRVSDAAFMSIGKAESNVFRCCMGADVGGSFALRGDACLFFPHGSIASYSLNGVRHTKEAIIKPGMMNLFVLAGGCFICWFGTENQLPNFSLYNPNEWFVYDKRTGRWQGPMKLTDLPSLRATAPADALAVISGMNSCAFMLADVIEAVNSLSQDAVRPDGRAPSAAAPVPMPIEMKRTMYCPHCWQAFQLGQALAVAAHPKLCGDSILGEDAQKRFTPVNVDAQGYPLDAMGMSVRDYACPWCHHKLPPFFTRTQQHIFSLIGIPAAGKTYYLSCLLHELEYALPREFGIAFRDADPSANSPLNAMRMRLFSAERPQDAYLDKTRQQGHLYHKVWKNGRYITMPRPFVYNLSRGSKTHSLVLYDTAGENCEPGSDMGQEQSAGHLAVASAIFFLFDPTSDASFRKLIHEDEDASLRLGAHMQERQALMLSETEMRLRTALRLPPDEKLDVPLAVIIGKSDTWQGLLGTEPLLPCVRSGQFQPKFVDANSKRLRQLLFNVSPHICANAEAISTNVRYFAVSSFGAAPETFHDERTGDVLLAPAGGKVRPIRVIDPMLWALHCQEPGLLSKTRN